MNILSIKETCLYVKDLSVTKKFYEDNLGFALINFVPERHVFFRVGESVLLCFNPEATKTEKTLPAHFAYGKQHIAFEVVNDDYQAWKDKLIAKGIIIIHEQHWKKDLLSFYFEDPDGHILEIVQQGIWEG